MENREILVLIVDVTMKILDNVANKDVDLDIRIINNGITTPLHQQRDLPAIWMLNT